MYKLYFFNDDDNDNFHLLIEAIDKAKIVFKNEEYKFLSNFNHTNKFYKEDASTLFNKHLSEFIKNYPNYQTIVIPTIEDFNFIFSFNRNLVKTKLKMLLSEFQKE